MKKNEAVLVSLLELVGLAAILFLMPAETTGQIIAKTALGLIWASAYFLYRKAKSGRPGGKDDEK